jgi:hypothetical protein
LSKSPSVFLLTRLASPYALLLAVADELELELGEALALAVADALGVAAGVLYCSYHSTWRNVSRAVVLTRFSVC